MGITREIEREYLAGLLLRPKPELIEEAQEDWFDESENKFCMRIIKLLRTQNREVNYASLIIEAQKHDAKKANDLIGIGKAYGYSRIEPLHEKLKERAKKKEIHEKLMELLERNTEARVTSDEMILELEDLKDRILGRENTKGKRYGDNGLGVERFIDGEEIKTGIFFVDDVIGGIRPKQLIIIGARTSIGKSSLALRIALNVADIGRVLIYSLEMDAEEIELRMLTMVSGVPSDTIDGNVASERQRESIEEAEKELVNKNIIIYDDKYTLEDIVSSAYRESIIEKPKLIVIDYLQLCEVKGGENRAEQVARISRRLKVLAKQLCAPIIALSQMNRVAAEDEPQLHHLRESGAIEMDANTVILMWCKDKSLDLYEAIVAKNRRGRTGRMDFYYDKKKQDFVCAGGIA